MPLASNAAFQEQCATQTDNAGQGGFRAISKRRDEMAQEMCECLIDIVAALFSVPSKELRKPGRSADSISRIRQIAMYVAHVVLQLTQGEVGRGFGRDRTTVVHACHTVEDLRDEAEFDRIVSTVEQIAHAAFRTRLDDRES